VGELRPRNAEHAGGGTSRAVRIAGGLLLSYSVVATGLLLRGSPAGNETPPAVTSPHEPAEATPAPLLPAAGQAGAALGQARAQSAPPRAPASAALAAAPPAPAPARAREPRALASATASAAPSAAPLAEPRPGSNGALIIE
jgi:hypothetical protein